MKRILVVDDDTRSLYLLESLFRSRGHEVVCATNGRAALERARREPPDLIVADVLMPVVDGFSLCQECSRDPALGSVPFVLYTGTYTDPKDEELAASLGAALFLRKPLEPAGLLAAVEPLLERGQGSRDRAAEVPPPLASDLELYNRRLVAKLEDKVDELEHTRRRLAQANARLLAMVNASDDAVVGVGPDDRITSWSRNAERILGWREREVLGRDLELVVPLLARADVRDAVSAARGQRAPSPPDSERAGERPADRGGHDPVRLETQLLTRDGHTADVEMALSNLGAELGLALLLRDVSERRHAREALAVSEAQLDALLAAGPAVLWWLALEDGAHRVEWVSPNLEPLLGWRPDEVRARTWWDRTVRQEDGGAWRPPAAADASREVRVQTPDGGARWMREYAAPPERAGRLAVTWVDVTREREEREASEALRRQLLHAQKMEAIGRVAGGVAHDFNNLLVVMLNCSEMALAELPQGHPIREDLEGVVAAARSATRLTKQLLAFSHQRGSIPATLHLDRTLLEHEKMLGRVLGEDVRVLTAVEPSLPPVRMDPVELEQVLMNLAVNARDAMPGGGTLTLDARLEQGPLAALLESRGPVVVLSVTDTGCGMDEATAARVFEPFFTTKEEGRGTGLGLSTVYAIVRRAGGAVTVESEVGRGTTFRVALPPAAATPDARATAREGAAMRGDETVLLVEDDEAVRGVAERILRNLGYRVMAAAGPGEALLLIEQHGAEVDLLLSDIAMPLMSGVELVDRIASERPLPPVLFMTGHASGQALERAVELSGCPHVEKPFTPQELGEAVRGRLDRAALGR